MKKTVYTLNIGNYASDVTNLTLPTIKHWAEKIGAEFIEITERKFPDFTITYEKHQVYQLSKEREDDWSIFVDSDTLIHPDFFDITLHLDRRECAHNGSDPAFLRWKYTREMVRDNRNIGSCTWFCCASDLTREMFEPPPDLTMEEIKSRIYPVMGEVSTGLIPPERLVEDFTFSHNIAKYGLRFIIFGEIFKRLGFEKPGFLYHLYNIRPEEKIINLKTILKSWGMITEDSPIDLETPVIWKKWR